MSIPSLSSVTGSVTGTVKGTISGTNTAERTTLLGLYVPEVVVDWYQDQRRGLGFKPVDGPGIYAIGIGFLVIGMYTFSLGMALLSKVFNKLVGNKVVRVILILMVLLVVLYTIYYLYLRPDKKTAYLAAATADFKSIFEGFQNVDPGLDSAIATQPLLNLQPLAIKQAGYIGPKVNEGRFDLDTGLREPLKNGVRFFTLQVDYLESKKDPKNFPNVGEPALLYRDDGKRIISANGVNLTEVAKKFADYAFSEEAVGSVYPLVLYLHFVRTPDAVKEPEAYLNFLSATAGALEPLFANHLSSTASGSFTRQRAEMDLLRTPVRDLSKKVVIMTNVDTSMFRRAEVLGMKPFESKYDLDYLTHVRVYSETSKDLMGSSGVAPNGKAAAVLVSLKRVLALSDAEKSAFAEMSKTRFVIAMPTQEKNPTKKNLTVAYEHLGVNCVPILPFDNKRDELKSIMKIWSDNKFLHTRPPALQAVATPAAVAPTEGV